ncbi:hypothetical protein GCM10010170_049810 [Dactylosporangium salmoneum]|uniref:Uncharacterized protein n=1 Tax=Dactylosporangium salmoneum TaxID=53361 RepID=A0ABP5TRB4_9ACTN
MELDVWDRAAAVRQVSVLEPAYAGYRCVHRDDHPMTIDTARGLGSALIRLRRVHEGQRLIEWAGRQEPKRPRPGRGAAVGQAGQARSYWYRLYLAIRATTLVVYSGSVA